MVFLVPVQILLHHYLVLFVILNQYLNEKIRNKKFHKKIQVTFEPLLPAEEPVNPETNDEKG